MIQKEISQRTKIRVTEGKNEKLPGRLFVVVSQLQSFFKENPQVFAVTQ